MPSWLLALYNPKDCAIDYWSCKLNVFRDTLQRTHGEPVFVRLSERKLFGIPHTCDKFQMENSHKRGSSMVA